jgi:hypothetical protein
MFTKGGMIMVEQKMKKFTFFCRRSFIFLPIALISLGGAITVLSIWSLIFAPPLQAQSVGANQTIGATFTCTPISVASFTNRVHVRCSAAAPGGIYWFAVSTKDSGMASRFLSIFTTAKVTGKNIFIWYDAADLSGGAWGCLNSDCRNISGAEVLN